MSAQHGDLMFELGHLLRLQLARSEFRIRTGHGRTRIARTYFVPDLIIIPARLDHIIRGEPDALDAYFDPLPLVVEIWSPSTGGYDIDTKVQEYKRRRDLKFGGCTRVIGLRPGRHRWQLPGRPCTGAG